MIMLAAVAGAVGVWAGFRAWPSATNATAVHAGVAILLGANVIFGGVTWWRAKPGSGDAMVLPAILVPSAVMLIGILPRLFWPSAKGLHATASLITALIVIVMLAVQLRRRRNQPA